MILTHRILLPILDALVALNQKTLSTRLKYQIAKNIMAIQPIKKAFAEACRVDIAGAQGYLSDEKKGISKAELDLKYPGVGDALKTKEREINELFDSSLDVSLYRLNLGDFPEEIDVDLTMLMPILEE